MDASALVCKIVVEFKKIEHDDPQPNGKREWTEKVLTTLCELGRRLCYTAWATNNPKKWLYDVSWSKCHKKHGRLLSVPMVAECEWGKEEDIGYDFEKLLLARAAVRVMVYGWKDTKRINEDFLKSVRAFQGASEDTYLLIAFVWDDSKQRNRAEFAKIVDEGDGPRLRGSWTWIWPDQTRSPSACSSSFLSCVRSRLWIDSILAIYFLLLGGE